jgi:hypothetical protein
MMLREMIGIEGKPFPQPLPQPAAELISFFRQHGHHFEDSKGTLILNEIYAPERWSLIQRLVESEALDVTMRHSIWPLFGDDDYEHAPLWVLRFPDIWIDSVRSVLKCEGCGRKITRLNPDHRVPGVKWTKPILSVNGHYAVVSAALRDAMCKALLGAVFSAFDEREEYYLLQSRTSLGPLVCKEIDFVNFRGYCSRCGSPLSDMFFGPLRYAQRRWNGDDVVGGAFHRGQLFTRKAYDLLREFEPALTRDGVALLE